LGFDGFLVAPPQKTPLHTLTKIARERASELRLKATFEKPCFSLKYCLTSVRVSHTIAIGV
jgi:hypothetical protein